LIDVSVFSCQKCKNEFKTFEELEEHLKEHQLKSKSTNLHLTCGNSIIVLSLFWIIYILIT
jgi:hypothetical protein